MSTHTELTMSAFKIQIDEVYKVTALTCELDHLHTIHLPVLYEHFNLLLLYLSTKFSSANTYLTCTIVLNS